MIRVTLMSVTFRDTAPFRSLIPAYAVACVNVASFAPFSWKAGSVFTWTSMDSVLQPFLAISSAATRPRMAGKLVLRFGSRNDVVPLLLLSWATRARSVGVPPGSPTRGMLT